MGCVSLSVSKHISLYILAILLIIVRFLTLREFGFKYTGSDDLTFWQCTVDYLHGIFHEPYFYGQNYNFAFESIIAVPLVAIGIPVYIALPVISTLIGIFPFFFFSVILFRKGYEISSYIFLLIPLTLPVEYDMITSMTRGFTSGLFFCSFMIFPLLDPTNRKSFIIFGLSASFGYIFNPNSLIFSLPVFLYLLFENYNKPGFYLTVLIASVPALSIQYISQQFYVNHPEYLVSFMWPLNYYFSTMVEGFQHLDKFFRYLTPVFWSGNWLVIIAILIIGIILLRSNWKKGLSIILTVIFIFFTLGVNKINDDIGVLFLSSTRMFLAVPLLLGLALFWAGKNFVNVKQWRVVILTIAISVFFIKVSCYPSVIKSHTKRTNYGPIAIKRLDDLVSECSEINEIISKYGIDLVVFIPGGERNVPGMEFYDYGCPVIEKNAFSSVMTIYERRTWIFQQEKNNIRKTLLLFNQDINQIEEYRKVLDCEIINRNPNMILIKNNDKTLMELSKIFHFELKRNTY